MSKTDVIAKGKYTRPHSDIAVEVDRYVIAKEKGSRFILLKLRNKKNIALSGVTVTITQFDPDGNNLGVVKEEVPVNAAKGRFVLTKKIAVNPACVDFTADIEAAEYGNYRYSCIGGSVVLDYTAQKQPAVYDTTAEERKLKGKGISVGVRKFRSPVIIYILAAILLACLALLTWLQLDYFTDEATGFRSSGVVYTFSENEDGEYDGVIVTGYAGKSSSVTIPATAGGYEVLAIGEQAFKDNKIIKNVNIECEVGISSGAFYGCTNLKTVTSTSITSIGDYAFYNCYSLKSVSSDNAVSIGDYAFYNCGSLTSVSMSEEAVSVGDYAFSGCYSLTSLEIPASVTYLGEVFLEGCDSLQTLTLPYLDTYLTCLFGGSSYYDNFVPYTLADLTIYGETTLPEYAFYMCSGLQNVTFAGSSAAIGKYAFSGCDALTTVKYTGDSLRIEDHAFYNCSNFRTLDTTAAITYIGNYAFSQTRISQIDLTSTSYIGDCAFSNSALISANMGANSKLTEIGGSAFSYCTSLVSVSIPSGVTIIDNSLFLNCTSLTTVQLNTGLIAIYSYAFSGCSSLTSLEVPSTVTTLGSGFIYGCSKLESLTLPFINTYLSYYFGSNSYASNMVPSTLTEVTITGGTAISDYAFYSCGSIQNITLPEGITYVGRNAFYFCTNLEIINLPEEVVEIGDYAFYYCSSLTSLEIPAGVTYMGAYIINGCNSLESLTLPYMDTYLSYYFGSSNYTYVTVPSTLTEVTVTGGNSIPDYAFYNCNYIETITLNDDITYIGQYAFYYCTSLENFEMPSAVQTICSYAFSSCRSLKSIEIPSTLVSIGEQLFVGCYRLYEIGWLTTAFSYQYNYIGDDRTTENPYYYTINVYYDAADKMERATSGEYEFAYAANRGFWYLVDVPDEETLDLPESFVTSDNTTVSLYNIPRYLFYNSSVVTVNIPAAVEDITEYAFYNAYNLKEVYFAQDSIITQLKSYVFGSCTSLELVELPESLDTIGYGAFWYCTKLTSITLPESLETINSYAFEYCSKLTSVTLPQNISYIYDRAFEGCYRLREVYNNSALTLVKGEDSNGMVAKYALVIYGNGEGDNAIHTNIDGLEMLYDGTEWYVIGVDSGVTTLTLGDLEYEGQAITQYKIASYAFYENITLTSVTIGSAVSEIPEYAFYNDYYIKTVDMSASSVTSIGNYAFYWCSNLTTVTFSSALESIGYSAFYNCPKITSLDFSGTALKTIGDNAFNSNTNLSEVLFSSSLESVGNYAFNCCYYITSLDFSGTALKTIGNNAFSNNTNLSEVLFSSSLESIGEYAFYYCYNLTEVDFSGTALTTIGYGAFMNDTSLAEVAFSSTLESIGSYAFASCSLTAIDLPSSLNSIGMCAFYYNTSLAKVIFRSTVDIGDQAFYGCTRLYEVYDLAKMGITKGYDNYGYAGYYAIYVYTTEEAIGLVYSGDWIFSYYDDAWWLVKYDGTTDYSDAEMPESFTDNNGNTVTSYKIAENVFTGKRVGNVVMPTSVTYMDSDFANGVNSFGVLLYKGTEDQFEEITGGAYIWITVYYYYEDCVHVDNGWTYDEYGNLFIGKTCYYEETQAATCTEDGFGNIVCSYCGEVIGTYIIDKTGHSPDEDGVCTACGEQGVYLTEYNLDSNGYLTVENDDYYPYEITDGTFISTNHDEYTTSYIIFTVTQDVMICVQTETSFLGGYGTGYMNVNPVSGYGTGYGLGYTETQSYSLDLQAGDTITISYYKREYYDTSGYDDGLSFTILIYA